MLNKSKTTSKVDLLSNRGRLRQDQHKVDRLILVLVHLDQLQALDRHHQGVRQRDQLQVGAGK